MDNLENKLGLTETLRILLPGVYFAYMAGEVMYALSDITYKASSGQAINIFLFLLISFLIGLIFYSIDLPKTLSFFKKSLPVKKIEEKNPAFINNKDLVIYYFRFYDKCSDDLKAVGKMYLNIYHLSINLFFISLLFIAITVFNTSLFAEVFTINIIICFLSFINSLLIFNSRIKDHFNRLTEMFIDSAEYHSFVEKFNSKK